MERQQILYIGTRRFAFVLEEQTLHTRVGDTEVMLGQLDRVLAVMFLPRTSSVSSQLRVRVTVWLKEASGYSTRSGYMSKEPQPD
jgi:Domain of unknown function (DUF5753)